MSAGIGAVTEDELRILERAYARPKDKLAHDVLHLVEAVRARDEALASERELSVKRWKACDVFEEEIARLREQINGRTNVDMYAEQRNSAIAKLIKAEARVAQLEAALRPFAAIGDESPDRPFEEWSPLSVFTRDIRQPQVAAARAALAKAP